MQRTNVNEDAPSHRLSVVAWWLATLATLVVLDDLTFGPAFWLLSRVSGTWTAVIVVYLIYVPVQVLLVVRGTAPDPGRIASFFLRRFDLERRSAHVARNEQALHRRVLGAGTALLMSLVIGGVLPPLLLWRQGAERADVRRLSVLTASVYATEFAVLHAVVPGSL